MEGLEFILASVKADPNINKDWKDAVATPVTVEGIEAMRKLIMEQGRNDSIQG